MSSTRRVLRGSHESLLENDPHTPCPARSAPPGSPRDAQAAARTAAGRTPSLAAGAHARRTPQRETRDRGHVKAKAPGAEPHAGCGLPGGAAPTCPCSPGECGSPRGLTCPRPPPPRAHYVMPRHAPAQPTGARVAERKHTVHVARAAGPCEGGGRRAGIPGSGSRRPPARDGRTDTRPRDPRLPPALTRVQFHGARRGAALTAPPGAAGGGARGPAS